MWMQRTPAPTRQMEVSDEIGSEWQFVRQPRAALRSGLLVPSHRRAPPARDGDCGMRRRRQQQLYGHGRQRWQQWHSWGSGHGWKRRRRWGDRRRGRSARRGWDPMRADRLPLGFLLHHAVRHLLPDGCAVQMSVVRRGRRAMTRYTSQERAFGPSLSRSPGFSWRARWDARSGRSTASPAFSSRTMNASGYLGALRHRLMQAMQEVSDGT